MKIADLSYFEAVSENGLIFGGASGTIEAYALAWGDDTLALTDTELELRTLKNGKVKLKGEAEALAVGEYTTVDTDYALDGFSKVKAKTKSKAGEDFAYEKLKLKAMS